MLCHVMPRYVMLRYALIATLLFLFSLHPVFLSLSLCLIIFLKRTSPLHQWFYVPSPLLSSATGSPH